MTKLEKPQTKLMNFGCTGLLAVVARGLGKSAQESLAQRKPVSSHPGLDASFAAFPGTAASCFGTSGHSAPSGLATVLGKAHY